MIVIMLFSIPIYVCSTSSVPIAAAMIMKGLSPGAALVFLIAGPATNSATITTIWKILGKKTTYIYLITMALTAIISGLMLDAIFANYVSISTEMKHQWMLPKIVNDISVILLFIVLLYSYFKPETLSHLEHKEKEEEYVIEITIKGMTCSHCVQSVANSLKALYMVEDVKIDLKTAKAIVYCNSIENDLLVNTIQSSGYTVTDITMIKQ